MGEIERIEARLNAIQDELKAKETKEALTSPMPLEILDEDVTTTDNGRSPYQIAASQKNPVSLSNWVDRNRLDPAIKVRTLLHGLCNMSHNPLEFYSYFYSLSRTSFLASKAIY